MDRVIKVCGKDVGFRATALTPRLYRFKLGRDIVVDLNALKNSLKKVENDENEQLSVTDLTLFENVAFVMARQYDNTAVPDSLDDWLDSFDMFSIYEVFPTIQELWNLNNVTTAKPKKK